MLDSQNIPLYRDGRHYDALHRVLPFNDLPFYSEEAAHARGLVLEIACGTGRLTIPIAQRGIQIVGLDCAPSMLAHARVKATEARVNVEWVEADCRNFDLRRKFALIFMPFNSMQHLHDHVSLAALFVNVRKHLAEGGQFIFDVFNPSLAILNRDSSRRYVERQYEDPDALGLVTLEQVGVYDDAAQVNRLTWYFSRSNEKDFRVDKIDLRVFFPQELDLLVRSSGFAIKEKFGDFERTPFRGGGMKQVVVCNVA